MSYIFLKDKTEKLKKSISSVQLLQIRNNKLRGEYNIYKLVSSPDNKEHRF